MTSHGPRWTHMVPAALIVLLGACASAPTSPPRPDPCSEPLYLRLKTAEPDSLSEREFLRLRDMDHACGVYRQQAAAAPAGGGGMMGGGSARWWLSGVMLVGVMAAAMLWRF